MPTKRPRPTDRVAYLRQFAANPPITEGGAVVWALVACLKDQEVAKALVDGPSIDLTSRRALLRRVIDDIHLRGYRSFHETLASSLMSRYPGLPPNHRQACGYCLTELWPAAPPSEQDKILKFFFSSPHLGMRRRGYKLVSQNWKASYISIIADVWKEHADPDCGQVIAAHFPLRSLLAMKRELEPVLSESGIRRLAIRLGDRAPDLLEALASKDEISWAYVLVKLGKAIDNTSALAMFYRNRLDERLGLLIWCFGKMRLWNVIVTLADQLDTIGAERLDAQRKKYGI